MYTIARYMLSPARPSVCLSVTRVDQSKTGEVNINASCNFHHTVAHDSSFLVINFTAKFQREHLGAGMPIKRGVGKLRNFQPISRRISETVQDRTKVTINNIYKKTANNLFNVV